MQYKLVTYKNAVRLWASSPPKTVTMKPASELDTSSHAITDALNTNDLDLIYLEKRLSWIRGATLTVVRSASTAYKMSKDNKLYITTENSQGSCTDAILYTENIIENSIMQIPTQ